MTNEIIKIEQAINLFGVEARAYNVIANAETGRIRNQKIVASRTYTEDGKTYRLAVELRFDDECNNGHETFAITGTLYEGRRDIAGGCLHDDIARRFPELAHLIKWHLCSTDGPMHYESNTVYLAGERDCGKGKARELDAARSAAIWPDATDEQLSAPSEELRAALAARLPALIEAFRANMLDCGFVWPQVASK